MQLSLPIIVLGFIIGVGLLSAFSGGGRSRSTHQLQHLLQAPPASSSSGWGPLFLIILLALAAWLLWPSGASLFSSVHATSKPVTTAQSAPGTRQYYIDLARQDAVAAGIDPDLFERQMNVESGWNPKAISPKGAIGIAQFMKSTADALKVDPYNPEQSLLGAAKLMASYVKFFHGSYAMALAAYNAGTATVIWSVGQAQKYGGTWENYLPQETQHYIRLILES
jgi:soluble lytic murein transglycosylase-like protein